MPSWRLGFFASEEEGRTLVAECGHLLDGVVTLDLPKEQDGVLLLGTLAFSCDDDGEEDARRRSGTIRGVLRDLGDHRVLVRTASGQSRVAPMVRATDGARELFDLGWELRQAGSPHLDFVIG